MKYGAIAIRGHRWERQLFRKVFPAAPHDTAKERAEPNTKTIDDLLTIRRDTVKTGVSHSKFHYGVPHLRRLTAHIDSLPI
jgi:hypothetical protein